ncbi:hypothetical protein BDQ12DRAFT_691580 [Crucibulum laeve]|uniref:Uncharacterized protein n=1 Tax=Crucibulum laeve TaxID=68775 RepID=A0A5C3LJU6_9AGAR|nr:hypothetical protein BDQ12DRAFT_691580 [Crucibulum laeve]
MAAEDCRQVLASDTGSEDSRKITQKAHLRLARSLHQLGDLEEASSELDEFRSLNRGPVDPELSLRVQILQDHATRNLEADAPYTRPMRYEVRVTGELRPLIIDEEVSSALCCVKPPEIPAEIFLMHVVNKYHDRIMQLRPWTCWSCSSKAVNMIHTPASYLHLSVPMIIDYVRPVCAHGERCGQQARRFAEGMARAAGTYYET